MSGGRFAPEDARQAAVDRPTDRWILEPPGGHVLVEPGDVPFRSEFVKVLNGSAQRLLSPDLKERTAPVIDDDPRAIAENLATQLALGMVRQVLAEMLADQAVGVLEHDRGHVAAVSVGIRPGDVIMEIDRQAVTDANKALEISRKVEGDRVVLRIWRNSARYVVLPIRKKDAQ